MLQFVPWRAWAWETLRAGHLPLWNPLVGMGAPLVANYQAGLFYPPNWLYFGLAALGGTPALAWGQGWLAAAHLAWAGLGMSLLVRRLGLGRLSQTVAGLAFSLSGYLVARAGFLSINATAAWVPWVLLALTPGPILASEKRTAEEGEATKNFLLLAVSTGMLLLAGHAQTAWYTLMLAVAWSAGLVWISHAHSQVLSEFLRQIAKTWLRLGAGLIAGVLLAAVQLLPTAEYLLQSQRASAVDYDLAMTYSFWPWRLLTLFAPGLFGSPVSGDYRGYGNYWEDATYIGLLPLLLAIAAIFLAGIAALRRPQGDSLPLQTRSWRRLIGFLAVLILAALILALGKNTPVFPWLYRYMPTFALFQAPTRYMLWAIFGLALLAALGAEVWRRPRGWALYWTRLGTAGAAAVALGAGIAGWVTGRIPSGESPFGISPLGVFPASIRAMATAGAFGVAVCVLALTAPLACREDSDRRKKGRWQWAVVSVLTLDLVSAGWGLNPAVAVDVYRSPAPGAAEIQAMAAGGRLFLPLAAEQALKFERFFRFDSFNMDQDWSQVRGAFLPNTNMLDGLPSVNNFDPLLPGRYSRWMETLEKASLERRQAMLNLMSVSLVESIDESRPDGVNYTARQTLPRLRWLPCASLAVDGETALEQVLTRLHEQQALVVEGASAAQLLECLQGSSGSVQLVMENPNEIEVRTQAGAPGYLFIADTWYPGWHAWVDGHPAPVWRANYLFRAVPLPAGEHLVRLTYRPTWFYLGAVLSGLSWLALLAGFTWISLAEKRLRKSAG